MKINTVKIKNGEIAVLDESQLITAGLNMNCDPVMTKVMLVERNGEVFCKSKVCLIKLQSQTDFTDYMLDTPTNRKALKASFIQ